MCGASSHLCLSNRIVVQCGELKRNIAIAEKLKIVAIRKKLLSLVIRIISSCDRICTEIVPMFIMKSIRRFYCDMSISIYRSTSFITATYIRV